MDGKRQSIRNQMKREEEKNTQKETDDQWAETFVVGLILQP
jgi:hypothetical protein